MEKPVFNNSFSVDDIHRLREYHYETTKNSELEKNLFSNSLFFCFL